MSFKLSLEEKEALAELLDCDGYKILVNKVSHLLLSKLENRIMTINLTDSTSNHTLILARASYDGAKRIIEDFKNVKQLLKGELDNE
jgi:hypothetical protein